MATNLWIRHVPGGFRVGLERARSIEGLVCVLLDPFLIIVFFGCCSKRYLFKMEFFHCLKYVLCILIAPVNVLLNFAVCCLLGEFVAQKPWIMKAKVLLDYRTQREKISLLQK